ncbi:MAG: lactate racemase domain-containing protein [Acidobacteriota bacterium]
MKYLTYSGNNLINADLPDSATLFYPPASIPGIPKRAIPEAVEKAFANPLGMAPLQVLVSAQSKVLIAFDDNCQPFPMMSKPDIRQIVIEALLPLLYASGVEKRNIQLMCAVALHRKMKHHELAYMLGQKIMSEFYPEQLRNFDAEDRDDIVLVGETEEGELVETAQAVAESDLVIYVDAIQIPLNGGHKSVAVGFGTYRSIAPHHSPQMTADNPNVMQPHNSNMHNCIERMSRLLQKHTRIMVLEAPMNGSTYPAHLSFLSKPAERCNVLEKGLKVLTAPSMGLLPEELRYRIFKGIRTQYQPLEINAGAIDDVHRQTLRALQPQLVVDAPGQYDTLVFGLPDLSPYSVGARINPVLVVSDVLGYVCNWFYNRPFLKKGGVAIILNPVYERFHPEYHAAYQKFWDEVLPETTEPFEMQERFQEKFAYDPHLIDCYRNRFAHHGFHPFTVWYWATYPLKYLSRVILVGPENDRSAKRLGVSWSPSLGHALGWAREITGGEEVVALTIPPFMYLRVP